MALPIRYRKGKTDKLFLFLISIVVTARYVLVEHRPIDSSGVVQTHLEEFLHTLTRPNNTISSDIPDPLEPYPIVVTPYNGTGVDPFYNIPSDGNNLWDTDMSLPSWIKVYLNWHKWRRQTWDPNHWADDRWMILQCLADQDKNRCGGASDRLKPLPMLLRIAYEHHRMLLIRWTRPALLETYLVPPQGGVDWRVPEWLAKAMANETNGRRFVPSIVIKKYAPTNLTLMRTRYQSNQSGKDLYDATRPHHEPSFEEVFAPLWRLFFRPSPAVAKLIQDHLTSNDLVPGHYAAAHLRALYAIEDRPQPVIQRWTRNAVNCASQIRPGAPIFFTSDSSVATIMALEYATQQLGGHHLVLHTPNPNPPLHIDRDKDWAKRKPSDYYDTFVDLYLLALAGCVAYSKGGYGHWGLLIGGNVACAISHESNKNGVPKNECKWKHGSVEKMPRGKEDPIFLDPMP